MRSLLVVIALLAQSAFADVRDPGAHFFNPNLGDFKAERDAVRKDGKRGILIMFEIDDCPFCHRMKTTVLNQSEVQDFYRQHFLIFLVNREASTPMTDFSGKETTEAAFALAEPQRVRATPAFLFYDPDGKLAVRFFGPTKDAAEFVLLGRYFLEGAYKSRSFNQFKQGRQ